MAKVTKIILVAHIILFFSISCSVRLVGCSVRLVGPHIIGPFYAEHTPPTPHFKGVYLFPMESFFILFIRLSDGPLKSK